jgi:phage tail sheath protein FI
MPEYLAPGVYVEEVPSAVKPIAGVGTSIAGFVGVSDAISGEWDTKERTGMPAGPGGAYEQAEELDPYPVNSWTEFTQRFGDIQEGNEYLAHAVYGFFNNGGTRCWVSWINSTAEDLTSIDDALERFEGVDEIAVVAAPLPPEVPALVRDAVHASLVAHCTKLQDRVAILDSVRDVKVVKVIPATERSSGGATTPPPTPPPTPPIGAPPPTPPATPPDGPPADDGIVLAGADDKGYGAFYFPWIMVADPGGEPGARVAVPPSGHVAGIYARSDAERGVHKAPANEVVRGALGVRYPVSKIQQGSLNPHGVNCIRTFDSTIKVYGARSLASDPEWTYISVRRLVNFLRESIDEGTQWVIYEPNAPELWSKIRRNVSAFLNTVWASGALLGTAPEQAFYVRCDETTNPPEVRDLGRVVAEIGVAVVKPAEFVIFRLSQWAGVAR